MKKCGGCKNLMGLSEFYKCSGRYHYFCKSCLKSFNKRNPNRLTRKNMSLISLERLRKRDREYQKEKRARKPSEKYLTSMDWVRRNPEKRIAHIKVFRAIKKGLISKGKCEVCGADKVHAHHDNYGLPLVVRWLCPSHHQLFHISSGRVYS